MWSYSGCTTHLCNTCSKTQSKFRNSDDFNYNNKANVQYAYVNNFQIPVTAILPAHGTVKIVPKSNNDTSNSNNSNCNKNDKNEYMYEETFYIQKNQII